MIGVNYYWSSSALGRLEIDNISNCYIEANTDDGTKVYFGTSTKYGYTTIFMYGPFPLEYIPLDDIKLFWKRITLQYNPQKIKLQLELLLNDKKAYTITQARLISREEFIDGYIDPMKQFLEFEGQRHGEGDN